MEVTNPGQLTGPSIRDMRLKAGKTQKEFWGPIGVSKGRASTYECGKHAIDGTVQHLVYLHHVCGFPLGLPHESMMLAGAAVKSISSGFGALKQATAIAEAAIDNLKSAQACMKEA